MKTVKKFCFGCEKDQFIWKNHEGHKYCLSCWNKIKPDKFKNITVETEPKPVKKPIKKVSDKRAAELAQYTRIRNWYLNNHSECQACTDDCTGKATEIHHMKGRIGKLLIDDYWFLAVCRACHNRIENNPEEAKENGWSISRLTKT